MRLKMTLKLTNNCQKYTNLHSNNASLMLFGTRFVLLRDSRLPAPTDVPYQNLTMIDLIFLRYTAFFGGGGFPGWATSVVSHSLHDSAPKDAGVTNHSRPKCLEHSQGALKHHCDNDNAKKQSKKHQKIYKNTKSIKSTMFMIKPSPPKYSTEQFKRAVRTRGRARMRIQPSDEMHVNPAGENQSKSKISKREPNTAFISFQPRQYN